MSESDVTFWGQVATFGGVFSGGAVAALIHAWNKYREEPDEDRPERHHLAINETTLADMGPLYRLLERNVIAVEANTVSSQRTADATDAMHKLIRSRMDEDEIDKRAKDKALDMFDRMKAELEEKERTRRRDSPV